MAASSCSTIPTVLDALRAGLVAVTALSGVGVYSGFPGLPLPERFIFFGNEISLDEDDPLGIGEDSRYESYTIKGMVSAQKPITSGWEAGIKAARDDAFALYAEVEAYLNGDMTIGGACDQADVSKGAVTQGVVEVGTGWGYVCDIDFEIAVQADKTPTA